MKKQFLLFTLVTLFGIQLVAAQTPPAIVKQISKGIVNGSAISLPKPEYPAADIKAVGAVNVKVTIDEDGNVISAVAVSGHPTLRPAAEKAALLAKFPPTMLSGQPVKVTGVIVYDFPAPTAAVPNFEEKVKVFAVSSFLSFIRNSATDLNKLNKTFDSVDFIKEGVEEYKDFKGDLTPLLSLEKLSTTKRRVVIKSVMTTIRAKLSASDVWQFQLGQNFGDFFIRLFKAIEKDKLKSTPADEAALKMSLGKIKTLTRSAPPDFPKSVLDKFKQFVAFDSKKRIITLENSMETLSNLMEIFETISPTSPQ